MRKVPAYLQMEATECGAVALGMVMSSWGLNVSPEELRDVCGVSRDGSNASNVLKAARRYGFEARGIKEPDLDLLASYGVPLVLFWEFNHFVVFVGRRGEKFVVNDPATGERLLTREEMDGSYTGVALEIRPGDGFRRSGRRKGSLKLFLLQFASVWREAAFVICLGFLLLPCTLVTPNLNKLFMDAVFVEGYRHWAWPVVILAALTLVATFALMTLRSIAIVDTLLRMGMENTGRFLRHLVRLPAGFFVSRWSGELVQRVSYVELAAQFTVQTLMVNFSDCVGVLAFGALLFVYDVPLAVLSLASAVVTFALVGWNLRRLGSMSQAMMAARGEEAGHAMQAFGIADSLKATGGEDDFFAVWAGALSRAMKAGEKIDRSTLRVSVIPAAVQGFAGTMMLGFGVWRILSGELSPGGFLVFQAMLGYFFAPLLAISQLGMEYQTVDAGLRRISDAFEYPKEPDGDESPAADERLAGRVTMTNVTFGYNPVGAPVLKNFNLDVKPGGFVAITGPSGSGKSTVSRLLAGFYRPNSGSVAFDGRPRGAYSRRTMRRDFAMVDQEITLFSATVRENLTMFDEAIALGDVMRAADDAQVGDVIRRRRGGFGAMVKGDGAEFSGGERQRLEIARALVTDPKVLVLDEATSALDAETEHLVIKALARRKMTRIVIAHRLSTIRDADEIIVLDRGVVVERGTHDELMAKGGAYAKLARS